MIWVMFWNISRIYIYFFSIQNIKSNCYIFFLKFLRITFFWWKMYSLPVISTWKGLIFVILCGSFLITSWFNATVTAYWKHFLSFLLMVCFFVFYPIKKIYIWYTTIRIYFMTFILQYMNLIEDKLSTFHWC